MSLRFSRNSEADTSELEDREKLLPLRELVDETWINDYMVIVIMKTEEFVI